jgi:hypothetical protein
MQSVVEGLCGFAGRGACTVVDALDAGVFAATRRR